MKKTNLIHINPYPKPKKDGGGGSSNITFNINTSDIGGDLNVKSLNANRVMAEYVEANNLEATNGKFVYLVASDGTISTLRGNNLTYDTANIGDLTANNIETQKLNVTDTATIENIFNTYLNSKEIVTDYLTVNKSAHFFEVIIDKIKSVGGTIINTATSCILDYVIPYNASGPTTFDEDPNLITKYRCYWKRYANENSQDKKDEVQNDWLRKDQAISQNCNLVSGVNHDAGNHYYWRLVDDTSGENPVYVNFDTGQVWNEQGIPEYKIKFSGHQADPELQDDVEIAAGFTYDNGEPNTEDRPDAHVIIDSDHNGWNIAPVSGIETDWNIREKEFTVRDTINGLQIMPVPISTVQDIEQAPLIKGGTFTFATEYPTRLNLFIFYDDETVEYHPAPDVKQSIYQINLASITGAIATRFVITSAEVNIWHLCNWIDLSNTDKDAPTHLTGTFDNAPRPGDNVCQLGYRYTELSSADLTDLGYDSSSTDTAGQSLTTQYNNAGNKQAWKDAHVDEVSRASAIIIAAYKTPDSGGTVNGRIIQPIKPPSYAQYQDIIDYNLYTHRGTYMDASGGYFKGNLVSESGDIINIGNDLTVDTEYYQLISNENPITRPSSGTKNITFRILYVHNGEGTILSSLPTDWHTKTSLDNYTDEDDLTVTIGSNTQSLEIRLYDENDNLKDTYVATTINLSDVTNGIDGAYNQWAYKNAANNPGFPEENSQDNTWSTAGYPPNNWSKNPTTPSTGQHTWMTARTCTPVSQTQTEYGGWSYPIRITGDDGQPGTDGDFTEFIYTRNDTGVAPSAPPASGTYPRDWPNNGTVNHQTDGNGVEWYDNPQGVSQSMKYEYISSRQYNGSTETWTDYCPPALWSKFGEKGMDGDGYEYIFKAFGSEQTFAQNNNNPAHWNANKNDDYTGPSGYAWSDDPVTLDSTTNKIEYVAVRKKEDGVWGKFSTPEIWAMYGGTGPQGGTGPSGPQGNNGEDGVVDKLVPYIAQFEVRTTSTDDYSDIVSKLYANLQYQVWHADGDNVSQVTGNDLSNYSIRGTVRAINRDILTYNVITSAGESGFTVNNNMFKLTDGSNYYMTNMLDHLGYSAAPVYHDYRKLSQSSSLAGSYLPIDIRVELLLDNKVVDSEVHEVIFKAGHVFEVTDSALNSAFFGSWKGKQGIVDGMSSIRQDMTGIQTNVSTLSTSLNGLQSDYSTFKQSAKGFQTKVESDYYDGNGNATIILTNIEQTATDISLNVQTDIEGELKRTGIDIKSGSIELNADKTTITGDTLVLNQNTGLIFNGTEYPLYVHDGALEHSGLNDVTEDELGTIISLSKTGSSASISTDETNIAWVDANKSVKFRSIEVWIPEYKNLTSNPTLTVQILKAGSSSSSWSTIYSGSISKANEYNSVSVPSSSVSQSSSTAGIWKMIATLSNINGPSSTTVNVNVYCELIAAKFSEIAGNGFNYILDSNTYFGSTGTSIVYDDKYMSLKTDDHKLKQKYIARDWVSNGVHDYDTGSLYGTIGTQLVPKILTGAGTVWLEAGTDVYLFDGGSSVTFYLAGGSARIGRVIYVSNVRSTSSVTHTITGSPTDPVQIIYNGQKSSSISLPQYKTLCLICISENNASSTNSIAGNSVSPHEWIAFGV